MYFVCVESKKETNKSWSWWIVSYLVSLSTTQLSILLHHLFLSWQEWFQMPNLSSEQMLFWKMPFLMTAEMFFWELVDALYLTLKGWVMSVGPLHLKGLESLPHPFTAMSPVLEKVKVQLVLQTVSQFPWHLHRTVKLWICISLPQMPKWLCTSKSVNTYPVLGVSAKKERQGKLSRGGGEFPYRAIGCQNWLSALFFYFFPHSLLSSRVEPSRTFAEG